MANNSVALPVIRRLPRYYRYLNELHSKGVVKISSLQLAKLMGTTASQIRQDFNCFGGFGQQGIGYNIELLCKELHNLLFSQDEIKTIIIGAGSLGQTIIKYIHSEAKGYDLLAVFDKDPEKGGKKCQGLACRHSDEIADFCKEHSPKVAVLCVPKSAAEKLVPLLVKEGIEGFWNFSHYNFAVEYTDVVVENVHISESLETLSYRMKNK